MSQMQIWQVPLPGKSRQKGMCTGNLQCFYFEGVTRRPGVGIGSSLGIGPSLGLRQEFVWSHAFARDLNLLFVFPMVLENSPPRLAAQPSRFHVLHEQRAGPEF